jgi:hypothetical protein
LKRHPSIESDMNPSELTHAGLNRFSRGFWFLLDKKLLDIALYVIAGLLWIFALTVAWVEAVVVSTSVFDAIIASSFTMAGFAIAAGAIAQQNKSHLRSFITSAIVFLVAALMSFGNLVAYGYVEMARTATSPIPSVISNAASLFLRIGELGATIFVWGIIYLVCSLLRWYHSTP